MHQRTETGNRALHDRQPPSGRMHESIGVDNSVHPGLLHHRGNALRIFRARSGRFPARRREHRRCLKRCRLPVARPGFGRLHDQIEEGRFGFIAGGCFSERDLAFIVAAQPDFPDKCKLRHRIFRFHDCLSGFHQAGCPVLGPRSRATCAMAPSIEGDRPFSWYSSDQRGQSKLAHFIPSGIHGLPAATWFLTLRLPPESADCAAIVARASCHISCAAAPLHSAR